MFLYFYLIHFLFIYKKEALIAWILLLIVNFKNIDQNDYGSCQIWKAFSLCWFKWGGRVILTIESTKKSNEQLYNFLSIILGFYQLTFKKKSEWQIKKSK